LTDYLGTGSNITETMESPAKRTKRPSSSGIEDSKDAFKATLRKFFQEVDTNGRGTLTYREVLRVLDDLGCKEDDKAVLEWFRAVDVDHNNLITFDELWKALNDNKDPQKLMEIDLRFRFMQADKNGSEGLTKDEFRAVLELAGWNISKETVDATFDCVDANNDGKVTVDEYLSALCVKQNTNGTDETEPSPAKKAKRSLDAAPPKPPKEVPEACRETFRIHLQKLFKEVDTNGRGTLTLREVLRMLDDLGCKNDEKDVLEWFRSVDQDHNDLITFEELWDAMAESKNRAKLMEIDLRYRFIKADKDGSKALSKEEFKTVLAEAGWDFTPEELDLAFTMVDEDSNGKVTIDEYLTQLCGTS